MKQLFVALTLVLCACNPTKKLQKAEQQVIYNPDSFNKIGLRWAELNPCANDTIISLVEAAVDSITFAEYLKYVDSKDLPTLKDTLPRLLKEAYHLGYEDATNKYLSVKVPKCRPVTKISVVVDRQKQKLDADSIQKLNVKYSLLTGQIGQLNIELSKKHKQTNTWIALFVVSFVLFIIVLGLLVYSQIKKIVR